jgi:hypothetical protein
MTPDELRAEILREARGSDGVETLIHTLAETGGLPKNARWSTLTMRQLRTILAQAKYNNARAEAREA